MGCLSFNSRQSSSGRVAGGLKIHFTIYQAGLVVAAQKWVRRLDFSVSTYYEPEWDMSPLVSLCPPLQMPQWMKSAVTGRSGTSRGRNLLTFRSKTKRIQFLLNSTRGWPGSPNSIEMLLTHGAWPCASLWCSSCQLPLSSISLAAVMQQSSAVKVQLSQPKFYPSFLCPPRACESVKLDMMCVHRNTVLCTQPTFGYLCDCVINHNQACSRRAMCAGGQTPPSTTGPLGHYCPPQRDVAGAAMSPSKLGLDLKGSIFLLVL